MCMPKKSAKKCSVIACSNLTYERYCNEHDEQKRKESYQDYKKRRTDEREQAFYKSGEWVRLRNHKRSISPLCEHCLVMNKVTPMVDVDHIVPIKANGGWSLRLTLSNLQSLCRSCHVKKTKEENRS